MKIASTTDNQANLDAAAAGRVHRDREPSFIFTEVGPSLTLPDGTIEHGKPRITTDLRSPKPDPAEFVDAVGPLTNAQAAAALTSYDSQLAATRSAYPDFDEVMSQTSENIPIAAQRFIVARLFNGPLVARYLAKHPAECEALNGMTTRAAQRRVEEISAQIATDPAFGMDKEDYQTFRRKRQEQIRNLHR
jgi:hypothetical protein